MKNGKSLQILYNIEVQSLFEDVLVYIKLCIEIMIKDWAKKKKKIMKMLKREKWAENWSKIE